MTTLLKSSNLRIPPENNELEGLTQDQMKKETILFSTKCSVQHIALKCLFYPRGISLPKIAYEISRISEIPKKIGRDFGISCKFGRDFRISENFCQGFLDFQGFPKHSNRQNSTWHSSSPSLRIEVAARLNFRSCGGVTPPPPNR